MCRLSVFIFVLANMFVFACNSFISDGVKKVQFVKAEDGSDEYDFEFKQENGEIFRGRTYRLNNPRVHLYMMFGPDESIYWARFSSYQYLHKKSFNETVRIAQRSNDTITMRDDSALFKLTISTGDLFITPYATKWNLEKICFTKADKEKKTFNYVITSDNNARTLSDKTLYNEMNDPHEQKIAVVDFPHCDGVYEVNFTDDELESDETFCKGIRSVLSQHAVFGAITVNDVNPKLLKTLTDSNGDRGNTVTN